MGSKTHPPILLLHGFLGSQQDFSQIIPTLSEQFYCIAPDLPGHGKTQTSGCGYTEGRYTEDEYTEGGYTFETTAQLLLSLLDDLNIDQTHLLGYSMGGRLALYLTCSFSERFSRVVLESASPGLKTAEERQARVLKDEAIAHQLETTRLPDFLAQWYQNPLFTSLKAHPEAYATMLQRRQNNNPADLAAALRGMSTGRQPSLWEVLPDIQTPLLLIVGELDAKFVALNYEMYEMATTAHAQRQIVLYTVKQCGHNIHLEASILYLQQIISFLTG